MFHDVFLERHMSDLGASYSADRICHFTLFDFVKPLPLNWMFILHCVMAFGALCISLGFFFNYTIWLHIIPYWYVFFLDKTTWNNHTYLFGLVSTMLAFTSANHFYSLDAYMNPEIQNKQVPMWNYGIFRYQFIIVYFVAGLKKYCDMDWMEGYSMGKLAKHWVFAPFTVVVPMETVNFFVVHLGGATLDLLGGWLLFFDKTRPIGIILVQKFHLMNMQMFSIGMFPYVMLCTTPMFCYPNWPRFSRLGYQAQRLLFALKMIPKAPEEPEAPQLIANERCIYDKETVKSERRKEEDQNEKTKEDAGAGGDTGAGPEQSKADKNHASSSKSEIPEVDSRSKKTSTPTLRSTPGNRHHCVTFLVLTWMAWQAFMPYSHFVTKGYNGWTEGLYGYSWDMMIKTWTTQHVRVSYKEASTGEVGYLNPEMIADGAGGRWSSHPDMLKQFAKCVQNKFAEFNVTNFKLYFDIWRSMTKRFQQRMFDPRVDLIAADWSPFSSPSWVMPLLSDLSDWRGRLDEIKKEKAETADGLEELMPNIVFAADFPGLYLENYINDGLDNTTIELLQGEIEIEFLGLDGDDENGEEDEEGGGGSSTPHVLSDLATKGQNITLNIPGQSIKLPHGEYHRIHTIGSKPSCYMFVYENTTDKAEYKKEMLTKRQFQRMVNASKEEPDNGRNFSDPLTVEKFFGSELSADLIPQFAERFKNMTEKEEKEQMEIIGLKATRIVSEKIQYKIKKVASRYTKAFYFSYHAIRSIWQGRPLEELLDELREEERKKMEAEAAVENPSVDNTESDTTDNPDPMKDDEDKIKDSRDSGMDSSDDTPVH